MNKNIFFNFKSIFFIFQYKLEMNYISFVKIFKIKNKEELSD